MSIYKRFKGKKLRSPKDAGWANATWYCLKRIRGQLIHKALPECQTKAQAEQAERRLIEKLFNRRFGINESTVTFSQFIDKTYLKYVHQHNVNVTVKELYIQELNKFFGKKLLMNITAQDCRDYQYKRLHTKTKYGTKRKTSSVNKEMSTLSKIFTLACQEGILETSPMRYVKKLEEPPPRDRLLTQEEKQNLWAQLQKDEVMWRIAMLAVNLPLRRGQILSITKESVDLNKRVLLAAPSKKKPARIIPLNQTALIMLEAMCAEVESGELIPIKIFQKRWKKCLVNAGINKEKDLRENNFHFHDLRKLFAMELLKNNVNPYIIQELFGHSSMQITSIYMPSDLDNLFNAVNSLDGQGIGEIESVN